MMPRLYMLVYLLFALNTWGQNDFNKGLEASKRKDFETAISSLSIGSKIGFSTEKVEFDFHFDFSKSKFVISGGGQDSFIAKIIPSAGLEVPFDFLLG